MPIKVQDTPSPDLHYDFLSVSSTIVPDVTDHGFTGVIRGDATGGARIANASVFGENRPVLSLTGSDKGGYLQLPDGVLNNENGLTISFFACVSDTPSPGCVFSFGTDSCLYLLSYPNEENEDEFLLFPAFTTGGRSQERAFFEMIPMKKNHWFHCAVSLTASTPSACCVYIDGNLAAEFSHNRADAKNLLNASLCCFGYGVFADSMLKAMFTNIRIYRSALTDVQISSVFSILPSARFLLEQDLLKEFFLSQNQKLAADPSVKQISLPLLGAYGCSFEWSSNQETVISKSGEINRPAAGQTHACVTLTASMKYQNEKAEFTFLLNVPASLSDEESAKRDLDSLHFVFPLHTISDLKLPIEGALGSHIIWTSNDVSHITNEGQVYRDQSFHTVTMTATATFNTAQSSKDFIFGLLADQTVTPRAFSNSIHVDVNNKTPGERLAFLPSAQSVEMTDKGILAQNRDRCISYLLLIDADRMLYNFRKAFGRDVKNAKPLGGWEEPAGLLRGHSTGHLLSALAYGYAYSGEIQLKEKADYIISELRSLQLLSKGDPAAFVTACSPSNAAQSLWSRNPDCWGEGFLSAYSPDQFALLEQFTPYATIWAPYYTLHKILAGLLDNYRLCGNEIALDCAKGIGNWVYARLKATKKEQREKMWSMYIAGEYGGMNESLATLSLITNDDRYREIAAYFDNPKVFSGLAKNEDSISGIHANQHIPQIIGAITQYRAGMGDQYYHIARNFWHLVMNHYLYSIGGVGRGEIFKEPDILVQNIEKDRNCETCAAYNLLKLTALLYEYEPDNSDYMDYYERALINQIAASQSPKVTPSRHNGVTYMLPIGPGAQKEYSSDYEDFTCCHGTGMENHVRYSEQIYHTSDDTLYINLYIASHLNWAKKDFSLSMDTDFPSEWTKIVIEKDASLCLKLRIPKWCINTYHLSFKNEEYTPQNTILENGYLLLNKDFKKGDTLLFHTPFAIHLCFAPDCLDGKAAASVMYGPLVMTAKESSINWICLNLPGEVQDAFRVDKSKGYPTLYYEDLEFVPMYLAHHMPYHTYFQIDG